MSYFIVRELACDYAENTHRVRTCPSTFTARPGEDEHTTRARAAAQGWTNPRGSGEDRCPKHPAKVVHRGEGSGVDSDG